MSRTDTLKNTLAALTGSRLNRYRLDIPSCPSLLDVEDFSGVEAMSQLYHYDIRFTSSDLNIDATQLLSKPATLTMGAGPLTGLVEQKVVHGVVTHFKRISGSRDQATYQISIEPFLALLGNQFRTHRFFVNKSVPEVVEQILREHGLHEWEYEFRLKQVYPPREQINQYQENDLAFIERLLADVRQSPLVALMNTLSIEGRTGQTSEALSDSLVKSAKNLFGQDKQPAIDQGSGAHGPLDATFGPVLALIDEKAQGMGSRELSLQTYLTRVTQVRLRLQQVTNATDPQAMTQALAQTVFQGKAIDLTETRDYGSLVAAGLGQEWSGFGQTVFVRPMEQAWQQVLTPAAQSLNAQWRTAVVDDWNSAFGGRYPFRDTSSEVSLPLLAKYLNGDTGRIARFLQTRLNGVLHKEGSHWVADDINAQGLAFNPAFLQAMDTLSHISDVAFTRGEAGLHFDQRPGTAAGIMQTTLVIDSQKLTYMNQMPVWKRFTWPEDTEAPGASLSWVSTQAGTRLYADLSGAWGFIRLLDKAAVSAYPGVNSSWHLAWQAPDGRVLNYTLRTEAGEGPLALLRLRHFTLPDNIFIASASDATHDDNVGDDEPSL